MRPRSAGTSNYAWLLQSALIILVIWLVLPMIPLFVWSFAKNWFFPDLLPSKWSLDSWSFVLSARSGVLASLADTLLIAFGTTALAVLIGVPAGRALSLYSFRGKIWFELLIFAPVIVPTLAVVLGIHIVFIRLNLANHAFGVILAHLIPATPYSVLVMASVFANYDVNYEAQARTLGASSIQVIWHVMLPMIMPGIIVAATFAFIVSWSQYITTLLIGGGKIVTLPLLLFNFASAGRYAITGAISVLYLLPALMMVLLLSRKLTGQYGLHRLNPT